MSICLKYAVVERFDDDDYRWDVVKSDTFTTSNDYVIANYIVICKCIAESQARMICKLLLKATAEKHLPVDLNKESAS